MRLNELLSREFVTLTTEELTELNTLLVADGIEIAVTDEETFAIVKDFYEVETVELENEEEEEMVDTTAATREEVEVTLTDKAKEFAEASKERLEKGFEFAVNNVKELKTIAEDVSNKTSEELEVYLKDNAKSLLDKIIGAIKKRSESFKAGAEVFPDLMEESEKCDNIIELIREVLDDDSKKGWGKFTEIVKAIAVWLVKLFFKVAAIVLKLAFTVIVGAIKIGCTVVTTTVNVAKVANKEIVKPSVKTGKSIWAKASAKIAERKALKDMLFEDDFEDDFEEEEE